MIPEGSPSLKIGIDAGGSSTKLVLLGSDGCILASQYHESPPRDFESAALSLLRLAGANRAEVGHAAKTGIGGTSAPEFLIGLPLRRTDEFSAIARGALKLSGLDSALVMSLGTGTCLVYSQDGVSRHMGGSGVGGGTLRGLSRRLFGINDPLEFAALAEKGTLRGVDIMIGDFEDSAETGLPPSATASNLGLANERTPDEDLAAAILNMIYQTTGTLAVMAGKMTGNPPIVAVGAMAGLPPAGRLLEAVGSLYGARFIIPPEPLFSTAVGAALCQCP